MQVVIGITQVARGIDVTLSEEGIAAQHLVTQRNDRIIGIAAQIVDAADGIDIVRSGRRLVVLIGVQHQREVYLVGTLDRVGTIGDEVLIKTVVAAIHQVLRDAGTLAVKVVGIKHHTFLQHPAGRIYLVEQTTDGRILDVIVDGAQEIGHARVQRIERAQLLTLALNRHIGRSTQITEVLHLSLQRLQRLCRLH